MTLIIKKFLKFNNFRPYCYNFKRYLQNNVDKNDNKSVFITAPIFYVNGDPHIGHLYTLVMADALHRFFQLLGYSNNIFSVGTDEHGIKIQKTAASKGIDPKIFCDEIFDKFKSLYDVTGLTYTHCVRTTEGCHKRAVEHLWSDLFDKGFIYKTTYSGWYSTVDETYVPEMYVSHDNGRRVYVETGNVVEWCQEENYLFKLSQLRQSITDWIDKKAIIKPLLFYEELKRISHDLKDISVSRPKSRLHWGIQVPHDETQTIYVWFDALVNYLSIAGYPDNLTKWPPDYQIIGKDILKFHALYWPGFLIAAGLCPPKTILCHSHWLVDNIKMSKSKGNVIDPFNRIELYTNEGLRYFLLRQGVPHSDGNYNDEKVKNYLNSELADTLGNLLSRCTAKKINLDQIFPHENYCKLALEYETLASELISCVKQLPHICTNHYQDGNFYRGIQDIMDCLRLANLYFTIRKPWELVKLPNKKQQLYSIIYINLETLRVCSILLQPIVPKISDIILTKLNIPPKERKWENAINAFDIEQIKQINKPLNNSVGKVFPKLI